MTNDAPTVTFKQVLKNRQFLLLWLAQFVSSFGDYLAVIALFSLTTFRLNVTPYQLSGILISYIVPVILLGPVAGVFVDRRNPKGVMIASDVIRAVLAASLAFTTDLTYIYVIIFALSAVSCFFKPAQMVAIPLLVRKEEILIANTVNTQASQFNKILGPAIAGLIAGWSGETICFYINSLSFILSAVLLLFISLPRELATPGEGLKSVLRELRDGLSFISRHQMILLVTASMVIAIFAGGAFDAVVPIYVRDILAGRTRILGALLSLVGIGSIIGAVLIGAFGQKQSKVHLILPGILVMAFSLVIFAAVNDVAVALVSSVLLGLGGIYVVIPSQTLVQEVTPQEILGRVSSSSLSIITVSQMLAFLTAGQIASRIGVTNLYYALASFLILTAVPLYVYARAERLTEAKAAPVADITR
jgi:DHA3 family macrolide efflux protein-like MFS transporter